MNQCVRIEGNIPYLYVEDPSLTESPLEKQYLNIKADIKHLYLDDPRVLSIGFSGGKDSSSILALTLEALTELPKDLLKKEVFVLYSDTMIELLPVQVHTHRALENIRNFAELNELPIRVIHARPELKNRFFSMVIGKGKAPPSRNDRFCTDRLKIKPQQLAINLAFGDDLENLATVSIVGSRKDESNDRKDRLERNTLDGHIKQHTAYPNSIVYAGIEDFSTEDVWRTVRSSTIGRDVLLADDLFALYASTNGEGEECQTILGNASANGVNPGCSKSGGRFGCWTCSLLKEDKAMAGMKDFYPYITKLIEFRNWLTSLRDGNWDTQRDVYNHGKGFPRLQYNYDNDRFGMTSPGGFTLELRKIILRRLLETEQRINAEQELTLLTDEELTYIQHVWLLEGDYSLTAASIAKEFGRKVDVSTKDVDFSTKVELFHEGISNWSEKIPYWFGITPDERFCAQFIAEYETLPDVQPVFKVLALVDSDHTDGHSLIAKIVKDMKIRFQFYPSQDLEKLIRREWKDDKVSFVTQSFIEDMDPNINVSVEEDYDFLKDEDVSLEDKMSMLDNWKEYSVQDDEVKFEHPEYEKYGGNFNYIAFKPRRAKKSAVLVQELSTIIRQNELDPISFIESNSGQLLMAFEYSPKVKRKKVKTKNNVVKGGDTNNQLSFSFDNLEKDDILPVEIKHTPKQGSFLF